MAAVDEETTASRPVSKGAMEKDIDGLPLRDHRKVDLKAILGQSPQVDDEEAEAEESHQVSLQLEDLSGAEIGTIEDEEGDEMEEDGVNCHALRQRRSSLRTQPHGDPPDSPTGERKAVRFADFLGLGLEAIRDVGDEEEPPEIPHSALTALRIRRRRPPNGKMVVLVPAFESPDVDGDAFADRLAADKVRLESCFACSRELTVSGVVRVATTGVSDAKTVTVRYTTDSWATHRDIPANYVPNSNDGRTDRFVFIIHLPEGFGADDGSDGADRLQFAVAFHAGRDTFWDDNGGENYVIDCVMRSREPSISGESKPATADVTCDPAIGSPLDQ